MLVGEMCSYLPRFPRPLDCQRCHKEWAYPICVKHIPPVPHAGVGSNSLRNFLRAKALLPVSNQYI